WLGGLPDLARRLHARRPRELRAQAQRSERRGQPRRRQRQPQLELRRRGRHERPRGERAARQTGPGRPGAAAGPRRPTAWGVGGGGDGVRATQEGNNNPWCQDGPPWWLDWDVAGREPEFTRFVRGLIALRRDAASLESGTWAPVPVAAGAPALAGRRLVARVK